MKMLEVTQIPSRGHTESRKWLVNPAHILEIGQGDGFSEVYFVNGTTTLVLETADQINALLRAL